MFNFDGSLIELHKQSGVVIKNISADVQTKKIFINDSTLPIEEGDYLVRVLPNGLEENYFILDRGYYDDVYGISAHYQVSVQKETTRKLKSQEYGNYNISGNIEHININSVDNSTNIKNINNSEIEKLFTEIREVVNDQINKNQEILQTINEMELNVGKPIFKDKYNAFIQSAANHMVLIAPFIPAITALLIK